MKKIWLYSVRMYLRLGMFFYFKKVLVHGINNIPKDKPVLLLGNHQNALLDPLLIAVYANRFSFFLTRAAVFKKTLISKILKSLQMLPVYRIRDGWHSLTNNNAIFETCSKLLYQNEAIVIFPEGNHNLERRVRPLSKGFTRIVFDTLEKYPNIDLQLVPIGFNYQDALNFPDSTSLIFGKPIAAKEFISKNRHDNVNALKEAVYSELKKLTTHIPQEHYEDVLNKLKALHVDFLKPKEVNKCIESGFISCNKKETSKVSGLKSIFKLLLIINLIVPYTIWKLAVQSKITELEFVSTFRFVIAITLVPFWVLIISVVLLLNFGWFVG
ncbi:lysophospholipid acyltransferase family protein [Seonamhaeicola sp. S2-3]|uniref:lysophospholipid acyltransferase family protein n=1 Tax=Seonamhaeicola sp. S2-3 TaxID=1936081 RepID=UPI001E5ECCE4|nr:lysophospholipid acyltransferase family protein [Seonamhaeicola sp. S2-3]